MSRNIFFLITLFALSFLSCAKGQIANITSNDPAYVDTLPQIAANIAIGTQTTVVAFGQGTIVMGKTWNCLAIYDQDGEFVYYGDGNTFMLDRDTIVCVGTNAYAKVSISTGDGIYSVNGTATICTKATSEVAGR